MTTSNTRLHQRPLGRTGLNVTEIGYGAWGIGADMWIGAQAVSYTHLTLPTSGLV